VCARLNQSIFQHFLNISALECFNISARLRESYSGSDGEYSGSDGEYSGSDGEYSEEDGHPDGGEYASDHLLPQEDAEEDASEQADYLGAHSTPLSHTPTTLSATLLLHHPVSHSATADVLTVTQVQPTCATT
jgi:hypothetical protein